MSKKILTCVATTFLAVTFLVHLPAANADENNQVNATAPLADLRPLMTEAINNGESHGILGGDAAMFLREHLGATSPLRVNVTTIKKYNQPGCSRLNVQFLQDNVKFPKEKEGKNREIDFQLSYCLDGRPPKTEGKEYVINNSFAPGARK